MFIAKYTGILRGLFSGILTIIRKELSTECFINIFGVWMNFSAQEGYGEAIPAKAAFIHRFIDLKPIKDSLIS